MSEDIKAQKQMASVWFWDLRDRICAEFEAIEAEFSPQATTSAKFKREHWQRTDEVAHDDGGGGEISILHGNVFEKAAVNVSMVEGSFSEKFRNEIPGGNDNDGKFWASGISLITHPRNPFVPPVHMNTRMIVTAKKWFGGGIDLNPIFPNDADTTQFHHALKQLCDRHHPDYYPNFSKKADDYFTIIHRNIKRGVGGIFYDDLANDWGQDFEFTKQVGQCFLQLYPKMVRAHINDDYDASHQEQQYIKRGHYTEFNLIYDRGTRFGLMTGGNVNAVLSSLPPLAKWP
ncbi:MAG: oxygen-dependent coproporphyrinogen oxidase [Alphaproteobacteria bacterium]|nr:oxygen-dependent coproporphyrinogen oxidase [Alphaproteobacteria bacterium]